MRNIAEVATAVADGDLSQESRPSTLKAKFLNLRTPINTMVDQLRSFASEVTRVAREVGTEESWAVRRGWKASPGRGKI